MGQKITFFSWKMFDIKIKDNIGFCDYNFDTEKADKLIDKEKLFLKMLVDLKINFNYLKIIPNELSKYFFNKSSKIGEMKFAQQVNNYFRKYIPLLRPFCLLTFSRVAILCPYTNQFLLMFIKIAMNWLIKRNGKRGRV